MVHIGKQSVSRPDSTALIIPLDGARQRQADFVGCCHCGRHHLVTTEDLTAVLRGEKKLELGFCAKCNHPTCPEPRCANQCAPYEQQIENRETGRPLLWTPTRVAFPRTLEPKVEN